MINQVLIFILFLAPLIFFHELGHFFFARLFKVRVETFSIGFGPKILKWTRGDTTYAISLIPFGGYVKMYGDDQLKADEVPEELKAFSFIHKKPWQRFWIIFGGPLANFIMAYFIFWGLLLNGEKSTEMKIGIVSPQNPLHSYGLRSGDVIKGINDKMISSSQDYLFNEDSHIHQLKVDRSGQLETLTMNMNSIEFMDNLTQATATSLRAPLFFHTQKGQVFLSLSSDVIDLSQSLEEIIDQFDLKQLNENKQIDATLFFFSHDDVKQLLLESVKTKKNKLDHILSVSSLKVVDSFLIRHGQNFVEELRNKEFYPLDLKVKSVKMGSSADDINLRAGDVLLAMDNQSLYSFEQLRNILQQKMLLVLTSHPKDIKELTPSELNSIMGPSTLTVLRSQEGQFKNVDLSLTPKIEFIEKKATALIGIYSDFQPSLRRVVMIPSPSFFQSFIVAAKRTYSAFFKTFDGIWKLITGEVSLKNVGGPLSIGKVASESFHTSYIHFLQIMAFISINLGLINLFPIPVLDGGHIVFLGLEVLNRGPLSRRKIEIAHQIGLSFLLLLMLVAIVNDFSRFFG